MNDNRREEYCNKHCDLVVAVDQRLRDFIERYEVDIKLRNGWRKNIETMLGDIKKFTDSIESPYRAGLWVFRIFIGSIVVSFTGFVLYLGRHTVGAIIRKFFE